MMDVEDDRSLSTYYLHRSHRTHPLLEDRGFQSNQEKEYPCFLINNEVMYTILQLGLYEC